MRTGFAHAPTLPTGRRATFAPRAGRACALAFLTFFASWTACYQVALLASISARVTLVLAVAVWLMGAAALRRHHEPDADRPLDRAPKYLVVAIAAALSAVVWGLAATGHRPLALDVALVAASTYLVRQGRLRRRSRSTVDLPDAATGESAGAGTGPEAIAGDRLLWLTGWVVGLASASLAAMLVRPSGDDAYFVNVSAWVADRGTFPLRDTMLSDQVFPGLRSHTPNVSSIESLFGTIAGVAGVPAGTITYVVMAPLLTLLAVLTLTWLVAESRIPVAPLALVAAVVDLWMSGNGGASFGNAFAMRIWEGKIVLVAVVVPLLIIFGTRLAARTGLRDHVLFGCAVLASMGASNTAVFLTPVIIGGLILAALTTAGLRPALRLATWLVYPLGLGVVIALTAPKGPTAAQLAAIGQTLTSDYTSTLFWVPGSGTLLVVTVLAIGLGWIGIHDRLLRAAVVGLLTATAILLLPPFRDLADSSAGIGPVLWRVWWAVPVPLLTAGVVGAAAVVARDLWWPARAVVVVAAAAAVGFLPLVNGRWIGSEGNGAHWATPTAWDVPVNSLPRARLALRLSKPGDIVLAPWDVSRVLAELTVTVHPVSARSFYLPEYAGIPEAHVPQRLELQAFADSHTPGPEAIPGEEAAIDILDVRTVCVNASRPEAVERAQDLGFQVAGSIDDLICLRR